MLVRLGEKKFLHGLNLANPPSPHPLQKSNGPPLISLQFVIYPSSRFIPINGDGQIYPLLPAISPTPTLHLAQFMASFFSKPTLLLSFSTCIFHVLFGCPSFLLLFTSHSKMLLNMFVIKLTYLKWMNFQILFKP